MRYELRAVDGTRGQAIIDNERDWSFTYDKYWIDTGLVDLLNKQDCLIKAYESDLDKANSRMSDLNGQIRALHRENEQLRKCLMER